MNKLPTELIYEIVEYFDTITIFKNYCINKLYNNYVNTVMKEHKWKKIWDEILLKKPIIMNEYIKMPDEIKQNNDYKNMVRLLGFNGCIICGCSRIRKVYWEHIQMKHK
jgi:hypothetical protein